MLYALTATSVLMSTMMVTLIAAHDPGENPYTGRRRRKPPTPRRPA